MKELSIEEKAKAYDNALERAKQIIINYDYDEDNNVFMEIFPELKESDEKFKSCICMILTDADETRFNDFHTTLAACLAWLEKQGEQSSLNINRECLKGIKRVQEYQDLSDWEKEFDKIASMYAHNKNQEGYNDSWYVKERAAEMLYYAKKELENQGEKPKPIHDEFLPTLEVKDANEALRTEYEKGRADAIAEIQKKWSEKDKEMIDETLYFIREYQQSNRCKDENGMQNSVTCEKWLKSLKERIGGKL